MLWRLLCFPAAEPHDVQQSIAMLRMVDVFLDRSYIPVGRMRNSLCKLRVRPWGCGRSGRRTTTRTLAIGSRCSWKSREACALPASMRRCRDVSAYPISIRSLLLFSFFTLLFDVSRISRETKKASKELVYKTEALQVQISKKKKCSR